MMKNGIEEEYEEVERELYLALINCDYSRSNELLNSHYRSILLSASDRDGWTAVHYAVWSIAKRSGLCDDNDPSDPIMTSAAKKIFADVIEANGFDVTATNVSGVSILHMACQYALLEIVHAGLQAGCDVNARASDAYKTRFKMNPCAVRGSKPAFPRDCDLYRPDSFCIGSEVTPLYLAARAGHADIIRVLIGHGADVGAGKRFESYSGITALQAAAAKGHVEATEVLLESGCDPNAMANDGGTALMCAVEFGHEDVVQVLLDYAGEGQRKVDTSAVKQCDDLGEVNCLHLAVLTKSERILRQLIEAGTSVNQGTSSKFTPLHLAAQNNCIELAQLLIDAGSDVNATTNSDGCVGLTALHLAIQAGSVDMLNSLISAGADYTTVVKLSDVEGVRLLHLAAVSGQTDIVKKLIQLGCDVEAETSAGSTPLLLAAKEGHVDVVEALFQAKKTPLKMPDCAQSHLGYLHIAVMRKSSRLVRVLRSAGCDLDEVINPDREMHMSSAGLSSLRSSTSVTPLLLAVDGHQTEMTELLIELGCSVNKALSDGITALHAAAIGGNLDVVTVLLTAGAHVDLTAELIDISAVTPLHLAVMHRHLDVTELLISAQARLNVVAFGSRIGHVTPLSLAIRNGDTDAVRALVDAGSDVSSSCGHNNPLSEACELGATEIVRILLEKVKCHVRTSKLTAEVEKVSALHVAALKDHDDIVELVVSSGCNVNAVDKSKTEAGVTALHLAAQKGNIKTVQKLLELGCEVNAQTAKGWTALHCVSQSGQIALAKILLDAGANATLSANVDDRKSCTALHLAAENGHADLTRLLLTHTSADVNATMDKGAKRRVTAVHLAAVNGHQSTVRCLLDTGANPDSSDSDGFTALHLAAQNGHLDVVRTLTSRRCKAVTTSAKTLGRTRVLPIHLAAEAGHAAIIRFLVAGGSPSQPEMNLEEEEVVGITPLHLAAEGGHLHTVQTLFKLGVDVNRPDSQGYTALHRAVKSTSAIETTDFLLHSGADPTLAAFNPQAKGLLPLHTAAHYGNRAAVKSLLRSGLCDINAVVSLQAVEGLTVLHLVAMSGADDVVQTLVKAGCDKSRRTSEGKTAYDIAAEKGFKQIAKRLK